MKKVFYFLMVVLYLLGIAGGFGYTMYGGQYVFSVGIIACAYMAWPKAGEYLKKLTE